MFFVYLIPEKPFGAYLSLFSLKLLIKSQAVQAYAALVYYLTIRLRARDFYAAIVDEGEARINYYRIEIESE